MLPIPVDALAGFPDGVPQTRATTDNNSSNGVVGFASVYAAHALNWTSVLRRRWRKRRSVRQNQFVMLYLNGGMDGLDCIVPAGSTANFGAYRTARPTLYRDLNVPSIGRVGSTVRRAAAERCVRQPDGLRRRQNGDTKGLDTLWGNGTGGAGSDLAYVPGMHFLPANGSHFDATDYIFGAAAEAGHGLARPLARPLRLDGQPAAGHLDRLVAVEDDSHGVRARLLGVDDVRETSVSRSKAFPTLSGHIVKTRSGGWLRSGNDGQRGPEPVPYGRRSPSRPSSAQPPSRRESRIPTARSPTG